MRKINHLYIIGNGFDLYHGLPTSYGNFRDYVKEHDAKLYDLVDKYFLYNTNSDFWSDFESNLGNFDDDLLREYGLNYLEDYGCVNWRDTFHHDYQFELDSVIDKITQGLHQSFVGWLSQISFNGVNKQAITLEKDVIDKLLNCKNAGNFKKHLQRLRKNGLIGHDDYSIAIKDVNSLL